MTLTGAARYAYITLAWLFLILLLLQVFLAGLGMFASARTFAAHADLGWMLHLAPILVLASAALARSGRRHWLWALALAGVVFLVPLAVLFRQDVPELAALHPVLAMISFALAAMVARNSLLVSRRPEPRARPPSG